MLHSILFVATIPNDRNQWQTVLNNLDQRAHAPSDAIDLLAENVWLLRLPPALPALGDLISRCTQFGIAYRILPFDGEPQWLPAGFGPNTIPARSV